MGEISDKDLKRICTRLIQGSNGFSCLVMPGPPPLIAEMFETWDDTYDAYCSRCTRYLPNTLDPHYQDRIEESVRRNIEEAKRRAESHLKMLEDNR